MIWADGHFEPDRFSRRSLCDANRKKSGRCATTVAVTQHLTQWRILAGRRLLADLPANALWSQVHPSAVAIKILDRMPALMNRSRYIQRVVDPTDRSILAALAANARITVRELAQSIGLSAPSVAERIHRLEDTGVIDGYTIIIDAQALGICRRL